MVRSRRNQILPKEPCELGPGWGPSWGTGKIKLTASQQMLILFRYPDSRWGHWKINFTHIRIGFLLKNTAYLIKFIFCEKATKFLKKILNLFLTMVNLVTSIVNTKRQILFNFLWPSQNIWTLTEWKSPLSPLLSIMSAGLASDIF